MKTQLNCNKFINDSE